MPEAPNQRLVSRDVTLEQMQQIAKTGQLYGILDACDAPQVPQKARELNEKSAVSLYRGSAVEEYWAIAPYLFHVDESVFDWIVETLWKEPWGIFVLTKTDLATLRSHLRSFLKVQSPSGEQWIFRYYDPRVLRTYLATCSTEDLVEFFGPIRALGFSDEVSKSVVVVALI